jgi:NAD(P)-dependent dehydrogenase (short-subunit alcohol dehydrogenase family)
MCEGGAWMNKLFSLEGKNAVVTGCASGIGQGLAVGLAKAGARIIAMDIADMSATKRLVEEAIASGDNHSALADWLKMLNEQISECQKEMVK